MEDERMALPWVDRYRIVSITGRYYTRDMLYRAAARAFGPGHGAAIRAALDDDEWMRPRTGYVPSAVINDMWQRVVLPLLLGAKPEPEWVTWAGRDHRPKGARGRLLREDIDRFEVGWFRDQDLRTVSDAELLAALGREERVIYPAAMWASGAILRDGGGG